MKNPSPVPPPTVESYNYLLPEELIAQTPASPRDHCRLLVIDRKSGHLEHLSFTQLPQILQPGDTLVFNDSKVIPARLYGTKSTGGKVELLLLRQVSPDTWKTMSHPGIKPSQSINISNKLFAQCISADTVKFNLSGKKLTRAINHFGHSPLPPYIKPVSSEKVLRRQYQNIFAKISGSVAAPTAGLHFTNRIITSLKKRGCQIEFVTLHVGLGTFKSPSPQQLESGILHSEYYELDSKAAARLNRAKSQGSRIIAVGTTACRVLESCTNPDGKLVPSVGDTSIFIRPGYKFRFIDGLVTNFHLPGSSLIMLVSAFCSWPIIKYAYDQAVAKKYRFFSFGDATLII